MPSAYCRSKLLSLVVPSRTSQFARPSLQHTSRPSSPSATSVCHDTHILALVDSVIVRYAIILVKVLEIAIIETEMKIAV